MGGAPFDQLSSLGDLELNKLLQELDTQLCCLTEVKTELNNTLYVTIKNSPHSKEQNILLALKRDIYNDRRIDFSRYYYCIRDCDKLTTDLCRHFLLQQRISRLRERIEEQYNSVIHRSFECIKEISSQYFLKNGLIFSSTAMFDMLDILSMQSTSAIKRQVTMTLSLLKYITRSVTKTSPFSSFNSIFLIKPVNQSYQPERGANTGSTLSINNLIFLLCKRMFLSDLSIKKHLSLFLNSTLDFQQSELTFFRNDDNKEFFCKAQNSNLISFVVEYLQSKHHTTYADLCDRIKSETGETACRVINSMDQLIHAGIISLHLPISIKEKTWPAELLCFLKPLTKENNKNETIACAYTVLHTLLEAVDAFRNTSNTNVRKSIIGAAYKTVMGSVCIAANQINLTTSNCGLAKLQPENIFYEDLTTDNHSGLNVDNLKVPLSDACELFAQLQRATLKKELRKQIALKIERAYNGKAVPLLSYYQEQISPLNSYDNVHEDYQRELAIVWNAFFQAIPKLVQNEEIDLRNYVPSCAFDSGLSFDLFTQIATIKGQDTLIVNNLLSGVATNISRFINLYSPDSIVGDIRCALKSIYKTAIVAELIDAAVHNTNTFPCITDHIIDVSGRESNRQRNINLGELWICPNQEQHAILINAARKQVIPIDFSMESIERKSGLMKFCDIFGPSNSESALSFLDTYENLVLQISGFDSKQIAIVPRLQFTDRIVFSRKKWFIKAALINHVLNQNTLTSESFVFFDSWRRREKIPVHVFVRTSVKKSNRSKPQYIDLSAPVMFMLFKNLMAKCKTTDIIEISEMLPAPEHLVQDKDGKPHVMEYIFSIYDLK
jgi:hypothetical protein